MTYSPVVVGSGLVAWQFLKATQDTQRAVFDKSAILKRDAEYFREKIGSINSAEDLVNDRRLLGVALSAFGLEDKIDAKFLIRTVLEEGAEGDEALANRLGDGRYVALARAFTFEKVLNAKTQEQGFGADMIAQYREKVLANMEAGLAESGDTGTAYGASVREQVAVNIETETAFFKENIGKVRSAQGLINSPRLYAFAMITFDLQDKSGRTSLIKRVLEQGAQEPQALANVLGDQRYIDLAKAFEFDRKPVSPMGEAGYADEIVSDYFLHEFEVAVGSVDESLRTALNFERAIPQLAAGDSSENTKWFQVLGTTSLRNVFESALGLPAGFSQIDIDRQAETLKDKMSARFGVESFSEMSEPKVIEKLIHSYLLQDQIKQGSSFGAGQTALTLLQSIPRRSLLG
ncbi:DUF1217 domain-containing protein [Ponticoccus gilvus]|nr:DUF1217 domain-containing protein [Enemella evansiae]